MALVIVKSGVKEDIAYSSGATKGLRVEDKQPRGFRQPYGG
jgi:hypothetical protein